MNQLEMKKIAAQAALQFVKPDRGRGERFDRELLYRSLGNAKRSN